ncbi:hypothetical protein OIU78_024591 [Salix suchowensis]|nr:hypothetical protein OIU78_024591 [Salix suchowensis]
MEFDLENPLTSLKEYLSDEIPDLFLSESDHVPSKNFLRCLRTSAEFYASFREEAISRILQAQYSCNYDPFIPYLAVNYMDRFISRQEIPQGKPWILRLVVISCLSLAAKMKNKHFSISNFQEGETGFTFDTQTINRMELVAQNEIKFLEFKPSIIAASAILVASKERFPSQFPSFQRSIYSCEFVNEENLQKCFHALQEMVEMEWHESVSETMSCTGTPLSVLDRHFTGSESETITNGSAVPEIKRRKLNLHSNKW